MVNPKHTWLLSILNFTFETIPEPQLLRDKLKQCLISQCPGREQAPRGTRRQLNAVVAGRIMACAHFNPWNL